MSHLVTKGALSLTTRPLLILDFKMVLCMKQLFSIWWIESLWNSSQLLLNMEWLTREQPHLETGRSVASNESAPRKTSIPTEYVGLKTIVKYNRQNLTKWVLVFSIKGKAIIDSSHISYLENQRTWKMESFMYQNSNIHENKNVFLRNWL